MTSTCSEVNSAKESALKLFAQIKKLKRKW